MNLISLSNDLKNLSDQQLAAVPHTSPEVPPYLLMAEMQRRDQTRKEYEAQQSKAPQGTVAQRLMQKFAAPPAQGAPPPQGGGIAGLAQGPQPPMAHGGIVGLADGGLDEGGDGGGGAAPILPSASTGTLDPAMDPTTYINRYPRQSYEDAMNEVRKVQGVDPMAPLAQELADLYAQQKAKKPDKWEALSQAGFAMMAEPTANFGRALGVAGLTGIANLQSQKDQQRQEQMDMLRGRIGVAEHQASGQDRLSGIAQSLQGRQNAYQIELANNVEAALRKEYDPETAARFRAIMAADPGMDPARAKVQAINQKNEQSQRVLAAGERAKAAGKLKEGDPARQMFNARVQQLAKKYKVQGEDVGVEDLPIPALDELQAHMQRVNPTEWSVLLAAAGGDPKKALVLGQAQNRSRMKPDKSGGTGVPTSEDALIQSIAKEFNGRVN